MYQVKMGLSRCHGSLALFFWPASFSLLFRCMPVLLSVCLSFLGDAPPPSRPSVTCEQSADYSPAPHEVFMLASKQQDHCSTKVTYYATVMSHFPSVLAFAHSLFLCRRFSVTDLHDLLWQCLSVPPDNLPYLCPVSWSPQCLSCIDNYLQIYL